LEGKTMTGTLNHHKVTPDKIPPNNASGRKPGTSNSNTQKNTHACPPSRIPPNNASGRNPGRTNEPDTRVRSGGFGAANLSTALGRRSTTVMMASKAHDDGVYCSAHPSLNLPPMPLRGNPDTHLPIFKIAAPPLGLTPDQRFSYAFWSWMWMVWEATAPPPQWMLLHGIVHRSVTYDEYHRASRNFLATIAHCCVNGMNNRPPKRNVGSVASMMNDPQWRDTAREMTSFISYVVNNFVNVCRTEVTTVSVQTANVFSHWDSLRSKLKQYGYYGCHRVSLELPNAGPGTNLTMHQLVARCRGLYINQYRLYRMIFRDFTISRGNVVIPREHLIFVSPEEANDVEQDIFLYSCNA